MADEPQQGGNGESAPARAVPARRKPPAPVRVFAEAEIKLVRMGRVTAVFRGAFATLRVAEGVVEFERGATAEVGEAVLEAERLSLDLPRGRLTAEGPVRIREFGAELSGEGLTAMPSLTGLTFHRNARIRTDSAEAARALFDSGLI